MDFGTYRDNLRKLDVQALIVDTLKELEVSFLDANIDQLRHGKRSTGGQIGKYASADYAAMKYAENSLAGLGNIDLILTGVFSKGITIRFEPTKMVFDSTGKEKENGVDLLYHYGDDVLGLSDESILKLQTEFQQAFVRNYYKKMA